MAKKRDVARNLTGGEFVSAVDERRADYEALRERYQSLMARVDKYNDIPDADIIEKFGNHAAYIRTLTGAFTSLGNAYKKLHPATAPSVRVRDARWQGAPGPDELDGAKDTPF